MKSRLKLRIKTGLVTNKTAGNMLQLIDKQPVGFIRNESKISVPNLKASPA